MDDIKWVEIHYTDLLGRLRVVVVKYNDGRIMSGVDGSSIGVEEIEESDVFVVGDRETLRKLPWNNGFARVIGNIYRDSDTIHPLDSRNIAKNVGEYVVREYGLTPLVGVELEYFVFKECRVEYKPPFSTLYTVKPLDRSIKGVSSGYHVFNGELDSYRNEVVEVLAKWFNIDVKCHHHEVASSQVEITLAPDSPVKTGDSVQTVKYIARRVAERRGYYACFTPKPLPGENGSGQHIHISLWRNTENVFSDSNDTYGLSQTARYFIGGLISHARALAALVAPSVNSYKRLIPGYEAPVYVFWGFKNRSTCIRVPLVNNGSSTRIEFRTPDPTCNPYLAISAVIMAGLDGIKKKIDPGDPVDENIYSLRKVPREKRLPASLLEALEELENDNEFLKPVFPRELIEKYIEAKKREYIEVNQHPSPIEILMYS